MSTPGKHIQEVLSVKASRIIILIIVSLLLMFALCSCSITSHMDYAGLENPTYVSETEVEEKSDFDLFAGSTINAVKIVQDDQGEAQYVPRNGEPYIYEGEAIDAVLSVGSYSSFPAKAKVFVMLDGVFCPIITNGGQLFYDLECVFEPVDYGEFIYDNMMNIPISFEPVFYEVKETYDLAFCVYVFDSERRTDDKSIPQSEMDARVSFCAVTYELVIADGVEVVPEQGTLFREPNVLCKFKDVAVNDDTDSLINLSVDPAAYTGGHCDLPADGILNLYMYFNTSDQYQVVMLIDGGSYNDIGDNGTIRYDAGLHIGYVASVPIDFNSLSSGGHSIDILVYNLTTKWAESHASFALHKE